MGRKLCITWIGSPTAAILAQQRYLEGKSRFGIRYQNFLCLAVPAGKRKHQLQRWYASSKNCNFPLAHSHTLIEKKRGRCASCKWLNYSILTDGNPDENPGEKTAFACQGTRLHLKCLNASEVIKVTRANYGRFSIAVCNDKSMTTWSVNCFSAKAQEVFASKSVVPFLLSRYFL